MNETQVVYRYRGIGALGALGLIFVVAKLFGVIAWSWWLVLLPFYAALALTVGVFVLTLLLGLGALILAGITFFVISLVEAYQDRKRYGKRKKY